MKNQLIITGIITLSSIFILSPKALAQSSECNMIYGGGQTCVTHPNISLNIQILEPDTKQFRDNLTAKSNYFSVNEQITFRITIKNTSSNNIKNVTVSDVIPASLTYRSGNGKYDQTTHRFSDTISELTKGQSKTYTINTIVNNNKSATACIANQASIIQDKKTGTDNATFCLNNNSNSALTIEGENQTNVARSKGGLPIYGQPNQKQTPQTGPEIIGILSLPAIGGIGIYLKKRSNRFAK